MLSSGTRIGPYHVESWIKEGSCGQSYKGEGGSGEEKGKIRYVKLFQRELSSGSRNLADDFEWYDEVEALDGVSMV
jgi:hypothetical protein